MKIKRVTSILIAAVLLLSCVLFAFVACNGIPVVESISVSKEPKTVYYVGDTFTPEGGEITAKLSDGTEEIVSMTDEGVSIDVTTATAGNKTATVTYAKKRARFQISVSYETFEVIFDLNYTDAPKSDVKTINKGNKAVRPETNPERDGYIFYDWFADEELTIPYDFDTAIKKNTSIYAYWLEDAVYFDAKFNVNYYGAKVATTTLKVKQDEAVSRPSQNPTRPGYAFVDWYEDAAGTNLYNFASTFNNNKDIYAKWSKTQSGVQTFTFEAEDTDFTGKSGPGMSTTVGGKDMIVTDTTRDASQNMFASYMYKLYNSVDFYVASDEDVSNVTFVARLGGEAFKIVTLNPENYMISVNGVALNYSQISIDTDESAQGYKFKDYTISTSLSLKKGKNEIILMTYAELPEDDRLATMVSMAPTIDCIKLTTNAVLMWDGVMGLPKANNY